MALRVGVFGALLVALELSPVGASAQRPPRRVSSVSTVEIAPTDAMVRVGQQQVLLAYAFDLAHRPVDAVFSFSSSNRNVARVDSTGVVVGVSPGTVLITARTGTGATAKGATTILTVIAAETLWDTGNLARPSPERGGPDGTLVMVGNIPVGARVTVDGRRVSLPRAKLPTGRHRVRVEAAGFQSYVAEVDVRSNAVTTMRVGLVAARVVGLAAAGECDNPQIGLQNALGACYDVRPRPRQIPVHAAPLSCGDTITPTSVLVRVDAGGSVETASVLIRSNCAAFTEVVLAVARDMTFVPATKNGQFVAAWLSLLIRPQPR